MSQGSSNPSVVIAGLQENDTTRAYVHVDERNSLDVAVTGPLDAFGDMATSQASPVVQIDAVYNLRTSDVETFIDSSPGTGSVTTSGSMFVCQTGAGVGGYGVVRSRRLIRYRPGQGIRLRGTAMFTTGVANSLQLFGMFTAADGLFFGYDGTTFGIIRRVAGAVAIHRLTVTTGATGVETITITLNGVAFVLPATSGALSTALTSQYIANQLSLYTGWYSSVSPTSNDSTVTWLQNLPAVTAGAFSLTSTGGAVGTFTTLQAGAANTLTTIPQTTWNVDTMDGSHAATNPSGILLDQTKLNVYMIKYPFLGAGPTQYFIVNAESARPTLVHVDRYSNANIIPSQKNPCFKAGWIASSLGSATNLTVKGASAAAFIEGPVEPLRNPYGRTSSFTAGTTEYVAIAFRVRAEFYNVVNLSDIWPYNVRVGVETSNRIVRVRVKLNPTMTGNVDWTYNDNTNSVVEYALPVTVTPSGGIVMAGGVASSGSEMVIDLKGLDVRIQPGDVVAITVETASSTSAIFVAMNWQEN